MSEWQPIETAPKGTYSKFVSDATYIEPPSILLLFEDGNCCVAHWDFYYAEGGAGCTDGIAWIEPLSGEKTRDHYGAPTHWMQIPSLPDQSNESKL